jgi:hypothetical protein
MHRHDENLTENHTTPIISEINTKQSINGKKLKFVRFVQKLRDKPQV